MQGFKGEFAVILASESKPKWIRTQFHDSGLSWVELKKRLEIPVVTCNKVNKKERYKSGRKK